MTAFFEDQAANLARLEALANVMQRDAESTTTAEVFGIQFSWRFPYHTATAYAHVWSVRDSYAAVAAWAFCRHKWRPSRNFEAKAKLVEGYVAAWREYCIALADQHIAMWEDLGTKRQGPLRAQYADQRAWLDEAYLVPTPALAHSIDVIRNNGSRIIPDLDVIWSPSTYLASPEAKAIIEATTALMEPATVKARRVKWEAAQAAKEIPQA